MHEHKIERAARSRTVERPRHRLCVHEQQRSIAVGCGPLDEFAIGGTRQEGDNVSRGLKATNVDLLIINPYGSCANQAGEFLQRFDRMRACIMKQGQDPGSWSNVPFGENSLKSFHQPTGNGLIATGVLSENRGEDVAR